MVYGIFVTNQCLNDCLICTVHGELDFKFSHLGKTAEERAGLENLVKSLKAEEICLTGGDPLRNPVFMEIIHKYHPRQNAIVFNPLTFLTLQLKKRAPDISKEEAIEALKLEEEELAPEIKRIIRLLPDYQSAAISKGNMQAPNPQIMGYARLFFNKYVMPHMSNKIKTSDFSLSGNFCAERLTGFKSIFHVAATGNMRELLESGDYKASCCFKPGVMGDKDYNCHRNAEKSINLFFRKEKGKNMMYIMSCCKPGISLYTSFRTGLSLEETAGLGTEKVKVRIDEEFTKVRNSKYYRLLNCCEEDWSYLFKGNEKTGDKEEAILFLEKRINDYRYRSLIGLAEQYIYTKTGKKVNIINETFSFSYYCKECEVCNKMAAELKKAGITPDEWIAYAESNYDEIIRREKEFVPKEYEKFKIEEERLKKLPMGKVVPAYKKYSDNNS